MKTYQEVRDFLLTFPQSKTAERNLGCDKVVKLQTVLWRMGVSFRIPADAGKFLYAYNIDDLYKIHAKMITDEIELQKAAGRKVVFVRRVCSDISSIIPYDPFSARCITSRLQFGYEGSSITYDEYEEYIGYCNSPTKPEEVIWLVDKNTLDVDPMYGVHFKIKGRT